MNSSPRPALHRMFRALLPPALLKRIADYRFGYSSGGRRFAFDVAEADGAFTVTIDHHLRLRSSRPFLEDLQFHFVANGQSRDEIGAFIEASTGLGPGALLLDVGAHRGLFALVHCALGDGRRALLLEPSPSLARDARELLAMNGCGDRAAVVVAGAGERGGRRGVVEDALGFAQIADGADSVATEFVTLDGEWRRLGLDPGIVKIDVEGAEAEVLRGAMALLADVRPLLFLELHLDELRRRGESPATLLQSLAALGYAFREPGGGARRPWAIARSPKAIVRLVAEAAQ